MIQTSHFSNGLVLVTDPIPTVETMTLGVWLRVGARYESREENGMSHFLEHMAFKGTHTRSARDIAQEIEAVGGYLNAFTSREMTAYHARILAEDFPLALETLSDILCNSVLADSEVDRERSVIQQEILESLDAPDDYVFDLFQSTAFPDQPIGRPILGTLETLASFTSQTVRAYMERHYSPNRMIVSAAGKLDHDKIVKQVERTLGTVACFEAPVPEKAVYRGGVLSFQKPLEQSQWLLGFEGVTQKDPSFYTSTLLATLLGGGMSSKLFQEVREKRGLVYTIHCSQSCYQDTGLFAIYASTAPHNILELTKVVFETLQAASNTFSPLELQKAKNQLKAGMLMGLESTSARCERAAQQIQVFGRVLDIKETIQEIDSITQEKLLGFAEKIFSTPPTCVTLGPDVYTEELQKFFV